MDSPEYTAFLEAVEDGKIEEVERFLTEYPNFLDLKNEKSGITPLHCAASNETHSVVELLLQRGSTSLDAEDFGGWTPLNHAVTFGKNCTVRILKAAGATAAFFRINVFGTQTPIPEDMIIESISEDEILEIRFRIYFSRSLLSRLLL